MSEIPPIVKVDRWTYRYDAKTLASCRLETFLDSAGRFSIVATERSDNEGPNITQAFDVLIREIQKWLKIENSLVWRYYERYDADSYAPPRNDLSEICRVFMKDGRPHWEFVPDDEWFKLYWVGAEKMKWKVRKQI